MSEPNTKHYEFGPFHVDVRRRLLWRGGSLIPLASKVFDTLLVLVQNSGKEMHKRDLIAHIWADSFVEEGNLAQNICTLRKALGEERGEHQYIVTVPGRGYCFVAQVHELVAEEWGRSKESIAGSAAIKTPVTSIAVLPFKPVVSNEDTSYLGIGLADSIILRLSNHSDISVRPTTSVLRYGEPSQDPFAIGRELGVGFVLDGIYQKTSDHIRVTAQLIRIRDGATLWAAKFDQTVADVFALQDAISEQVVFALSLKLSNEDRKRLTESYTDNAEAFELYLKGGYFWNKRTVDGLRKGIQLAKQALELDPGYAIAYVGIADSYNLLAGHGGLVPKATFPKAKAAALQALEIDANLAEAHSSLGFVSYRFDWDWTTAEASFRRAIGLKPYYPTAHHWYGEFLAAMGRFEESITELRQALELDPLSLPINTDLAQSLYFARRYNECDGQLRKTLELEPNFIRALILSGMLAEWKGRLGQEAIESLQRAVDITERNILALANLGYAYAITGRPEQARKVLDTLEQLSKKRYVSAHNIALIHVGLKDNEQAFKWLNRAIELRDVWLVWLKVDPRMDVLRSDPRFFGVLRAVGLMNQ